jgi:signal transduction histidine kinase
MPVRCKDGSVRTVLWNTANVYTADAKTIIATIANGQDITERNRAEEEHNRLQGELIQVQKMDSLGTLAGGIAHDFNNILGIILAYTYMLEKTKQNPEKFSESISAINQAVQRGTGLVRQILTFARKSDGAFEPMSIIELIHELLSMLNETFPKIITFTEIVAKDLPNIYADRTQIHRALLNLCMNARDVMPQGGTITIRAEKQTKEQVIEQFPTANQDAYICISVSDTGEGMTEATRCRIFDPFFTTKPKGKGTGMGLPVVYGVIQAHKGFINVASELGHGTTFRLYFPILNMIKKSIDHQQAEPFDIGGTETILIVEDEKLLIEMIHFLLVSKGYKVLIAHDGAEAVAVYKKHKEEIALVLTDLDLPLMTGLEEYKKLKEIDPSAKVIFISGFFDPDVKSELLKAGVDDFIKKPFKADDILRSFRKVLDK